MRSLTEVLRCVPMSQHLGQMRVANLRVPNPAPRNGKRLPVLTLGPREISD